MFDLRPPPPTLTIVCWGLGALMIRLLRAWWKLIIYLIMRADRQTYNKKAENQNFLRSGNPETNIPTITSKYLFPYLYFAYTIV